jgi:type I restriction enzyme, S subunit
MPHKSQWPTVRLGEVLKHRKEFITIDDLTTYKRPRVQLHVKGIVLRDEVPGALIKTKTQQVCRTGEFLVAEIDAKVGGFGIVPESLNGSIVSSHYFLFIVDELKLNLRFLDFFIRTPTFREQVEAQGSTNYAAIRPAHVHDYKIPLPPLAEQRRIVARIEELAAQINEARTLRRQAAEEAEKIQASYMMHLFDKAQEEKRFQVQLGKICSFQGGSQPPKLEFAYEPKEGYVRLIQIRDYKSADYLTFVHKNSVRKFCTKDDVMIGRYGPPIFQILRGIEGAYNVALMKATPDERQLSKDFLFHLLQEPRLFQKVEEDSQRSSGQTGIRRELLEEHITYVPPLTEQCRIVAELDALQAEVDALNRVQAETAVELEALLPSILDKAFKGEL